MKKFIGLVVLFAFSGTAHSYQYLSSALDIGYHKPYVFCLSKTTPLDAAVTSFSVKCAIQGPGYYGSSPNLVVPNKPLVTQIYGYQAYPPNVSGTHTIIGNHVFWTFGISSGNLASLDSINWIQH